MRFSLIYICFLIISYKSNLYAQTSKKAEIIRIVSYNVENLFDTIDNPHTNDNEFTPQGKKHWTSYRYWAKQHKLAQTLTAVGEWDAPAIIGLYEIENKQVLLHLTNSTSLKKFHYEIIHREGSDKRGIETALLYRPEWFKPIYIQSIAVHSNEINISTRDILYTKGLIANKDTLHVFINHWPSRLGGQNVSDPKRLVAAKILKHKTDSILQRNSKANIIIMGDFNDEPTDKSIQYLTQNPPQLSNLMSQYSNTNQGTLVYKNTAGYLWFTFDQIICSPALLSNKNELYIKPESAKIFKADFLLETNKAGFTMPNRTYIGPRYHNGYSDHLPIYVDVQVK